MGSNNGGRLVEREEGQLSNSRVCEETEQYPTWPTRQHDLISHPSMTSTHPKHQPDTASHGSRRTGYVKQGVGHFGRALVLAMVTGWAGEDSSFF